MNTEWKLVPVEPTDEMEVAAENDYEQTGATFPRWKSAYAAMLAAAPPAPTSHPIPTGATGEEQDRQALLALADRIESASERPIHISLEAARLIREAVNRAPAAGDAQMLEFVREVAQQKPEKPDHWSSCSQCERNTSTAEELLEAYAAIAQQKGET